MTEREFLIYLDPETRLCRYRHYHVSDGKEIVEFRIQLEILVMNGTPLYDMTQRMENLIATFFIQTASKPKTGSRVIPWRMSSQSVKATSWKTGCHTGIVLSRR